MAENKDSFEQRLERLESIVARLEREDVPLEESVTLYKEGMALAKACGEQLKAAKNEVKLVTGQGLEDFPDGEGESGEDDDG